MIQIESACSSGILCADHFLSSICVGVRYLVKINSCIKYSTLKCFAYHATRHYRGEKAAHQF